MAMVFAPLERQPSAVDALMRVHEFRHDHADVELPPS
jgi:hypothetical protein